MGDFRFVRGYFAVGIALVALYHWLTPATGGFAYEIIGVYGAVGALVGALRQHGDARQPWLVFAAGTALMVAGDLVWDIQDKLGQTPSSPGWSDACYFVAYPLLVLGLWLLTRRITSGRGNLIDTGIVAVSLVTALWPLLFATFLSHGQTLGQQLTVGVYPVFDIVLVTLAARIALSRTMHTRRTVLLVVSVALFLTGDVFWFDSVNTYVLGDWMDYAWLTAYVCFGTTALHPTPIGGTERPEVGPLRRFAFLAFPVALLPAVLFVSRARGHVVTYMDGSLISLVLLLLLARFGQVLRGLDAAHGELREQNRLKDELISVVSHDLRTPLTSIMGYLELALADDTDPAERREFLEVVRRNTGRLHRLVEDLLFVSRVQAGRQALELAPVDVGALARESVAAALPAAAAADVEITCRVVAADVILADGHRVAEVLENLLSNAVKFTPPGGRVDVRVGRAGNALTVHVSDTGVGISEEDCGHLFDRFFRASGTEGVPGAGLGLSIVKAIVDAHGGHIEVHSRVGHGTTFAVRLPRVIAASIPVSGEGPSPLVRMGAGSAAADN